MATVTLQGKEVHTNGMLPAVGEAAPDFRLVDNALQDKTLSDYQGKKKLLYIVASLDTTRCASSAKRFNELVKNHDDTVLLLISSDLPFAQQRFIGSEKLGNVSTLSMMRSRHFAKDYGVLIEDGPLAGIMARAVVVLDEKDRVIYSELVSEISREPDYNRAMAVL